MGRTASRASRRPSLFGHALHGQARLSAVLRALVLYLLIWFVWWLPSTRLGRAMRAVRDNELAAETIGVHTLRTKVIAFTMCAVLGGIGGGLYAAGFSYISPDNFNFPRSIEFLTAVLLGGAQSPFGGSAGHRADRAAARVAAGLPQEPASSPRSIWRSTVWR